ncbi:transcriptional regulator, TetR family [Agrococcus baldri]|uniref:Transcriptional regulator, TetR family n=2 Tax=Agrococcus baldri TaxID=153730 RepID=A0AA94L002_9MICO|nr:transcriptional regulator, TetR family [Agrococcus baldri]
MHATQYAWHTVGQEMGEQMASEDVSRVVALAWGVAAAPQRGPKRELSHERIVETAIEIADAEGLPAVTMQRVAQSFGYTTMAIYRYVATKDDLHQLMLDAAFADLAPPAVTGDWREGLGAWMGWLFEAYGAHPWVLDIPISMEALLMPSQMRLADAMLRTFRDLPATDGERLALLMSLSTFLRGMAGIQRDIAHEGAEVSAATKALIREVATPASLPALQPLIDSGAYFGEYPGESGASAEVTEEDFAIGFQVWMAGIAAVFESREAVPQEHPRPAPETPAEQHERAEVELAAGVAARKAAEQRVKVLYKEEAALRKRRDSAKELAKAAARAERG